MNAKHSPDSHLLQYGSIQQIGQMIPNTVSCMANGVSYLEGRLKVTVHHVQAVANEGDSLQDRPERDAHRVPYGPVVEICIEKLLLASVVL